MTFMMTPSNDDKSDIGQLFYQGLLHIANTFHVRWTKTDGQKHTRTQINININFIFYGGSRLIILLHIIHLPLKYQHF